MNIDILEKFRRVYLATPYTKTGCLDAAAADASALAGDLLRHKIRVFSPIAHSHSIAIDAGIDPKDQEIWAFADESWLEASDALLVAKFAGWDESSGVQHEISKFMEWRRPIFFLNPYDLIIDSSINEYYEPSAAAAGSDLGDNSDARKKIPLATGLLDYFPLALAAVAETSYVGSIKHNPGQPMHWNRPLSGDHPDCLMRHFVERGKIDSDGIPHSAKVAWRALAILQLELESAASNGV